MKKQRTLQILLYLGACYYAIGAIVHYYGITLFPWFDGNLYTPYHDSVIALVALIFSYLLIVVARDPLGQKEILKAVMVSAFAASLFSVCIIWKVDFATLGAPGKELQTIVEGIIGFLWTGTLASVYALHESSSVGV